MSQNSHPLILVFAHASSALLTFAFSFRINSRAMHTFVLWKGFDLFSSAHLLTTGWSSAFLMRGAERTYLGLGQNWSVLIGSCDQ